MKRVEFTFYDWPEFEKFLNQLPNKDAAKLLTIISKIERKLLRGEQNLFEGGEDSE